MFAIVDDEDYEAVSKHRWSVAKSRNTYYAITGIKVEKRWTTIRLHRFILSPKSYEKVDHIDTNGLNNIRSNLRICDNSQNACNCQLPRSNTSGYKGVSLFKPNGKWVASIKKSRKRKFLGYFSSPEEAHEAYKAAAKILHGEFCNLQ